MRFLHLARAALLLSAMALAACDDYETSKADGSLGALDQTVATAPSSTFVEPEEPAIVSQVTVTRPSEPEPQSEVAGRTQAAELVERGPLRQVTVTGPAEPEPLSQDAARIQAAELVKAGKRDDASNLLKSVGLDDEAYGVFAPADFVFNGKDYPQFNSPNVSEQASSARHSIVLDGKTVRFTARAGHLIAYSPKDKDGKKDARAAIFYMAYTRDDLPAENRPVTFFFNGGPGSSSIYLHLGAFGPKRTKLDVPYMPLKKADIKTPVIDNMETLLDYSDLVFVDPVSTGFSTAIEPYKNGHFANPKADAAIVRDFVTSYSNKYGRRSSPKYLVGESFGASRVALAGSLMIEAGDLNYDPDPTGRPANLLAGIVLFSPYILGPKLPEPIWPIDDAMTEQYFQNLKNPLTSWSAKKHIPTVDAYADYIRTFVSYRYLPATKKYAAEPTPRTALELQQVLDELRGITGDPTMTWANTSKWVHSRPKANWTCVYDSRMVADDYNPNKIDVEILGDAVKKHLPDYMNYFVNDSAVPNSDIAEREYVVSGQDINPSWERGGYPELAQILAEKSVRIVAMHGYYDLVTSAVATEFDLKQTGLDKLIPIKTFEGGHMAYYSEVARPKIKQAFAEFYAPAPAEVAAK
ncbi:hypothetical protein GF108_01135 [Phyllobacterium sp. SYP-B3895]|uniref:S10 family serine carboxypeptidase-like protein n=1 Tax=Phyllobacterium sp. SYP-B3895 TaxID=2663240 RepID=UPI0012995BED|nr:hypothetical protein [Phyllobacterium sp. SYP-B3895]MRG54186.1 hypothetical protein [Phyllobacterium sp. SYP-B3895]